MDIKKSEIIFILIMVMLFVGFYFGIYRPQQKALIILDEELKQNTAKFEALKKNQGNIFEVVKKNIDLKFKIKSYKNRFVAKEELGDIISSLTNLINENRIISNSMDFSQSESGKNFDNLEINFKANGSKADIEHFLWQLENFEKDISIQNISLNNSKDGELNVALSLKLYLQKEEEPSTIESKENQTKEVSTKENLVKEDQEKDNQAIKKYDANDYQKSDTSELNISESISDSLDDNKDLLNMFNER